MKLFTSAQNRKDKDDNLIPLINVVFLMLIFFMLAGQITASDAFKVTPPSSLVEAPVLEALEFEVLLNADGDLALNNTLMALEDIKSLLSESKQSQQDVEINVALKADADVSAAQLKPLLTALTEIQVSQVTLYTRQVMTQP
ncbi:MULTISPECIES: ExbD/TolR family protein [Nitrincola]|uniref:Biopolymer transport protein ExbD n=1 Tax=Nitrincola nitratireducens TaxID=1229521 RepID=W9UQW0_9GAMM|nr:MULTISPECIES: biopolymer transporter ExbD [Nitrincola]EXJ09608.1 biopolymer transport protein ExbD [Nitrincola nitratireducens]